MSKDKKGNVKRDILWVLIERVPNPVRLDMIERLLPQYTPEEVNEAIIALEKVDKKIKSRRHANAIVPNRVIVAYELVNALDYPMKETFALGDQIFQRYFIGDMAGAEDMMEKFEALQSYLKSLEQKYADLTNEMTKRYWLNMITLFGLFISVFALIIKGSDPIVVDATLPIDPWLLVQLKVAQLFPLALILFAFIIILRLLLTKF